MKALSRKLTALWVLFLSLFIAHTSKAASSNDISKRINTIRKTLREKTPKENQSELSNRQSDYSEGLGEWVNWGNWGNWNNWNNWVNWNNWGNWGNWRNY